MGRPTSCSVDSDAPLCDWSNGQAGSVHWSQLNDRSRDREIGRAERETTSSLGNIDYDIEGRLTARPGQILEWDDLGRLTAVKDASTQAIIAAYSYDALDRLLVVTPQSDSADRFRYVGLTSQVAQIADHASGDALRKVGNGWSGERLLDWTGTGSDQHFYGTNGHHDVTWLASDSGTVTSTLRYDPWGNLTASSGSYLPAFRFQGSWFDATVELAWVVARWYAPGLGRFISEDTPVDDFDDPGRSHLYAYGSGDPVARWDAGGRYWVRTRTPIHYDTLALNTLGVANRWRMLWNANRLGFSSDPEPQPTTLIPAAKCMWIPVNWLMKQDERQKYAKASDNSCSRYPRTVTDTPASGDITTREQLSYAQKLAWRRASSLFNFTRSELYSFTDWSTQWRPRDPTEDQWETIHTRVDPLDDYYWRTYRKVGTSVTKLVKNVRMIVQPTGRPFDNCGGAGGCTFGQLIFFSNTGWRDNPQLQAHEYIHVLQWQQRGETFLKDNTHPYNPLLCGSLPACGDYIWGAPNGGPLGTTEEAAAYIWGAWTKAFAGREQMPWKVWKPEP